MKQLKIYGASDDLIEVDGFNGDEIGCYSDDICKGKIRITSASANAGLDVHVFYDGTWSTAPAMMEEDCLITFPVRIEQGTKETCPYSTVCIVDCPDDATWAYVQPDDDQRR